MFELLYESKGVGLAANQVVLPWRVFVINSTGDSEDKDQEFVFINPEITGRKGSEEAEEGCLSLPELYGDVRRPSEIVVEAWDLKGQEFQMGLSELPARVVQHENDHLDGVLFVDRLSDSARREIQPRLDDFRVVFQRQQDDGQIPAEQDLNRRLNELESQA